MNTQTARSAKKEKLFIYLAFLTSFFLLFEISIFIRCNKAYLSDFSFVADKIDIPFSVLPAVIFFLLTQLFIHLAYCVLVWRLTLLIAQSKYKFASDAFLLGIAIWLIGILTVLVANCYFFPSSKFSVLFSIFFPHDYILTAVFILLLMLSGIVLLIALIMLFKNKHAVIRNVFIASICFLLFYYYTSQSQPTMGIDASTVERPNIIIIGLDSLRPDFLSYFGHEETTPFFDAFLNQATVFTEAVTPLARTFPSWVSILTGEYPRQHGIRSNLEKQDDLLLKNTLPAILKRNGYETIYATDETRFNNMDERFGFDHVITPPMGLNDFLLGTFNDFPLSNLLVNTSLGQWLFPYSYSNRPVYFTYDPDSFLKMLCPAFTTQRSKPIFLVVHFCLTHHPYLWSNAKTQEMNHIKRYEASINRVDRQVEDLFKLMHQNRLLDHAIVVMLSDHGEALELPGDRITEKDFFLSNNPQEKSIPYFYPPSLDNEAVNQSAGHGTDVLGLSQYHSLLAFRFYGLVEQIKKNIPGVVPLVAVKPTILELLGLNVQDSSQSASLARLIMNEQTTPLTPQHIFLESDFSPVSIHTVYPETEKVLLEGIQLFQIDSKTTRLTVKKQMLGMIIRSKQYADIYGEWMLALYPQDKNVRMPILVNLVSGEWTNDMQSFFALKSPANVMLKALKAFYGHELDNITTF